MPLSPDQVKRLSNAVLNYRFPTAHYDFVAKTPMLGLTVPQLEVRVRQQLLGKTTSEVMDGLSNVLYWGYAQMGGLSQVRVDSFRAAVTTPQLQAASRLFNGVPRPGLHEIARLKLPQFSMVSFVSKVRMFLDPVESATLDRQIMQMHQHQSGTVLAVVREYKTSIPLSRANSKAYEGWCNRLAYIVRTYLPNARVVDVERGLFHMIQENNAVEASQILKDA